MRIKTFLFLIGLGSILSLVSWLVIIFSVDPGQAGFIGFSVFYLSLFLTLLGLIFLVGQWLRTKIFRKQIIYIRLNTSLRQAVLFALLLIGWAFLQSYGLAHIWNVILLILVLTSLEFFFVTTQKQPALNNERTDYTT